MESVKCLRGPKLFPLYLLVLKIFRLGVYPSISNKEEFLKDTFVDVKTPKIKTLDPCTLKCQVARSHFEDGDYDYDIGIRFIPPNTEYLKQLVETFEAY